MIKMNLFQKHVFHSQGMSALERDHSAFSGKLQAALVYLGNTVVLNLHTHYQLGRQCLLSLRLLSPCVLALPIPFS